MPRIRLDARNDRADKKLQEWMKATGNGTSTYDICAFHAMRLKQSPFKLFTRKLKPFNGEPLTKTNEYQWDVDDSNSHPPYEGIGYECDVCGKTLTEADD